MLRRLSLLLGSTALAATLSLSAPVQAEAPAVAGKHGLFHKPVVLVYPYYSPIVPVCKRWYRLDCHGHEFLVPYYCGYCWWCSPKPHFGCCPGPMDTSGFKRGAYGAYTGARQDEETLLHAGGKGYGLNIDWTGSSTQDKGRSSSDKEEDEETSTRNNGKDKNGKNNGKDKNSKTSSTDKNSKINGDKSSDKSKGRDDYEKGAGKESSEKSSGSSTLPGTRRCPSAGHHRRDREQSESRWCLCSPLARRQSGTLGPSDPLRSSSARASECRRRPSQQEYQRRYPRRE